MGMFDTLRLPSAHACAKCAHGLLEIQTKVFGNLLKVYQVGDVVDACDIKTGVLEESLYCPSCSNIDQRIYITLWHSLISGVYSSAVEAEAKLFSVDRADILNHLMRHQSNSQDLRRRYLDLFHTLEGYWEYVQTIQSGNTWDPGVRYLSTPLPEVVKDANPLARILETFQPTNWEDFEAGGDL